MNLNFFWHSRFLVLQEYNRHSGEMVVWVWEIRCKLQHSVSNFGDFCTLLEGVSDLGVEWKSLKYRMLTIQLLKSSRNCFELPILEYLQIL